MILSACPGAERPDGDVDAGATDGGVDASDGGGQDAGPDGGSPTCAWDFPRPDAGFPSIEDNGMNSQQEVLSFALREHPEAGYGGVLIGDLVGTDASEAITDFSPVRDTAFRSRVMQIEGTQNPVLDLTLRGADVSATVDMSGVSISRVELWPRHLQNISVRSSPGIEELHLPRILNLDNLDIQDNPLLCFIDLGMAHVCADDPRIANNCEGRDLVLLSCCP